MDEPIRHPKRPTDIELQGGVTANGKPFVLLYHEGKLSGQLSPLQAVHFGTRAIMAAIEAERDAGVVRAMHKLHDGDRKQVMESAASVLSMIREERDQVDPDDPLSVIRGEGKAMP